MTDLLSTRVCDIDYCDGCDSVTFAGKTFYLDTELMLAEDGNRVLQIYRFADPGAEVLSANIDGAANILRGLGDVYAPQSVGQVHVALLVPLDDTRTIQDILEGHADTLNKAVDTLMGVDDYEDLAPDEWF